MGTLWFLAGVVLTIAAWLVLRRFIGFGAQTPKDYVGGDGAEFDLRQHLNGPIACEGVIYGPTGRVTSRFTADFEADWQGNVGRMTERFFYESGAIQNREWKLELDNNGRIRATAPDLIGEGLGTQDGSAVRLKYRIKLPEDSGGHVLDTTDWMYLAPNGSIVNRSQFRKFGITVAELVAVMRPKEAA
ncbi:MAG: DUF3833 domain-containing protein [Rhodobacteraceae bacterium]|nr:DUF3833 domain-containing protein [Paracoccaceae bacterium]